MSPSRRQRGMIPVFAQLVNLFKIRIGLLMAVTAMAGYAANPGAEVGLWPLLALAVFVLVASASAGAFNQYVECDIDRLMARTANRPFLSGALPHHPLWLLVIALLLGGAVVLATWMFNWTVGLYLFLGAFFYGVVYTLWLKRRTPLNIVIGGLSGSFAVLAGAAAANSQIGADALLLALVLFLWTPPHFWALAIALHKDYENAGVPMLPVVRGDPAAARIILANTLLLGAVSVLPYFAGMGAIYLLGAAIGSGYFIWRALKLVQAPSPKTAMQCFFASLVQLSLILLAVFLDRAL